MPSLDTQFFSEEMIMENECQVGRAAPPDLAAKSALLAFLLYVRRRFVAVGRDAEVDVEVQGILNRIGISEREQLLNDLKGYQDFAALSGFRESDIPVLDRALEIVCGLAEKLAGNEPQRLSKKDIYAQMTEAEAEVAKKWKLGWDVVLQLFHRTRELKRLPLRCVKETRLFSGSAHALAILALLRHEQVQPVDNHRIVRLFLNVKEWQLLRRSVDAETSSTAKQDAFMEKFAEDRKLKGFVARVLNLDRLIPAAPETSASVASDSSESIFDEVEQVLAADAYKSPTLINGLSVSDTVIMETPPPPRREVRRIRSAEPVAARTAAPLRSEDEIAAFLAEELEKPEPLGKEPLGKEPLGTTPSGAMEIAHEISVSKTSSTTPQASSAAQAALSPQRKLNQPKARPSRLRSEEEDSESLTQDIVEIAVGIFLLCVLLFVVPQRTYYFGIWWWSWFFGAGATMILTLLLRSGMRFGLGRFSSG